MLFCTAGSVSHQAHENYAKSFAPKNDEERLLLSSGRGELRTVKEMLDKGVSLETADATGRVSAVFREHVAHGSSALHLACANNQVEVAQYLLERAKKEGRILLYLKDDLQGIPLISAINGHSHACTELLLESGMDIRQFPLPNKKKMQEYVDDTIFIYSADDFSMNPFIYAIRTRLFGYR